MGDWIRILMVALVAAPPNAASVPEQTAMEAEVRSAETAFAQTMADRDHERFQAFLSDQAVFVGTAGPLRGKQAVADGWKRFYERPEAPFSWRPELVVALESGDLALSSGPVFAPDGRRVGTFNSIWRREHGAWKVLFDKGCPPCECPPAATETRPGQKRR
jgi:ketosteroid isomerase-like protein